MLGVMPVSRNDNSYCLLSTPTFIYFVKYLHVLSLILRLTSFGSTGEQRSKPFPCIIQRVALRVKIQDVPPLI